VKEPLIITGNETIDNVIYGPEVSFYDDRDNPEWFRIRQEEDGVFLEFFREFDDIEGCDPFGYAGQIVGCTLVEPQIKELIKVLKKELKRLK
jgi:hypothetical protein